MTAAASPWTVVPNDDGLTATDWTNGISDSGLDVTRQGIGADMFGTLLAGGAGAVGFRG